MVLDRFVGEVIGSIGIAESIIIFGFLIETEAVVEPLLPSFIDDVVVSRPPGSFIDRLY